jgi:hypothetical protein
MEYVLRALLLQAFYSVRSERQLVEQLDYNLLFRWFVGLGMDDAVWNHAVFWKNRDRLLGDKQKGRLRRITVGATRPTTDDQRRFKRNPIAKSLRNSPNNTAQQVLQQAPRANNRRIWSSSSTTMAVPGVPPEVLSRYAFHNLLAFEIPEYSAPKPANKAVAANSKVSPT